MKSIPLRHSGAAIIPVNIATIDGIMMKTISFIIDTGATTTAINKKWLIEDLGYTEEWIRKNKLIIPKNEKPKMANGKYADVYKIPITRINIGGHELQLSDYILTSDTVEMRFLLGLDVLRFFKFTFDFDAIDNDAPHGRMFYELRKTCVQPFTKLGEPFAHSLINTI